MWEVHYVDGGMDYVFEADIETEAEADTYVRIALQQGLSDVRKQFVRKRKDIDD